MTSCLVTLPPGAVSARCYTDSWEVPRSAAADGRGNMAKVPDGFHYVRGHIRRNPKSRSAKRMSGWMIAGLLAGAWLWGQVFGFDAATPATPSEPNPAVSTPADR
jgi:hypothetical protein